MNDHFYKQLIEQSPAGYAYHKIICDETGTPCDYAFVEVNPAFEELTGMKGADIIGKPITKVLPGIKKSKFDWIACYGEIAIKGEKKEFEQYSEPLDRWYKVSAYSPEKGYFITIFSDISNEHRQMNGLQKLTEITEVYLQSTAEKPDYQKATEHILEISGAKFAIFNLYEEDGKHFNTMAIAGKRDIINKAMGILGIELEGKRWTHDKVRADKIKDQTITRFTNLSDLTGDVIPRAIITLLTDRFNLGETLIVKITRHNIMLGDFTLIMQKGKTLDKDSMVELYAKQLGLVIGKTRAEEALKMQNNIFKTQQDVSLDGIIVVDANDQIISFNQRFSDIWGIPDEIMALQSGEKARNYVLPKLTDPEAFAQRINHLHQNKQEKSHEEVILKDGRVLECYSAPIIGANEHYYGRVWYYRDITGRKLAEDELRRFKIISDNALYGKAIADIDGKLVYVNRFFADIHGYAPEELTEQPVSMLHTKKQLEKVDQTIARMMQSGQFEPQEIWHVHRNGTEFPMLMSGIVIRDEQNSPQYLAVSAVDITATRKLQDELQASEELLNASQRLSKAGGWEWNVETQAMYWTEETYRIHDFAPDEMEPGSEAHIKRSAECYEPEDRPVILAAFQRCFEEGQPYDLEFPFTTVKGRRLWIRTTALPVVENGKVIRIIGNIMDITERKEIEHQLYQEKERFKTTLLSVGDGVISTDVQGNVSIMNKISEQLTGWTQEEAVGKPIEEVFNIINEFSRERCDNPVQMVLETGDILELVNHTLLISKDGIERPIEDSAAPIKDEQGDIAGVVLVFRDFTDKKKRQDEIKYLSLHDHLTGLYNRRYLEEEFKRLDTERNWPLTIVMGDVNGLKLINDSFGHAIGDQLLIKAAKAIKNGCRADDIIARIGGDEFVILLPKTDDFEAEQLITRIKNLLKKERVGDIEVSISFGYESKRSEADEIETVFKKAEDMMYHIKLFEGPSIRGKVIDNIVDALNKKSIREEVHSKHVSELCERMGIALGLKEHKTHELKALGVLHDIGKIAVSDDILNKAGELTASEWLEMKRHSEIGYRILSTAEGMLEIAEYVLAHHERWDGKGYPKGLKGEDIPLESRICAIADAYDAMISKRSYKSSLTTDAALAEIRNNAGTQFDPELVRVFVDKVLCENVQ